MGNNRAPLQTLRNMTVDEIGDHLVIGGTLPPGAVKHLVMVLENVHELAAGASNSDGGAVVDEIGEMTRCPLADWDGE